MISKPIIPVEIKIVTLIKKMKNRGSATLYDLLVGEQSLPDLIASFLGVLELIKVGKLVVSDELDETNALLGENTRFILNDTVELESNHE